jgi:hypothetical protein
MAGDTSTSIIQLVLLAAIILAPWFSRSKRAKFYSNQAPKEQVVRLTRGLRPGGKPRASPVASRILAPAPAAIARRHTPYRFYSEASPEQPPCKSGQLEKDLGLQASSLRHAARLIIFKIMRSFFLREKIGHHILGAGHMIWTIARALRSSSEESPPLR